MKKFLSTAAAVTALSFGAANAQTVIFEDDFEAYNDSADVTATAEWEAFQGTATLVTDQEAVSGTNAIFQPETGGTLIGGHTPVDPADLDSETPLVVTVQYFDADEEVVAGGGIGLRSGLSYGHWDNGTWGDENFDNFFAIGTHSPDTTDHYAARVVNGGSGWTAFDGEGDTTAIPRQTGWRELQIRIYPAAVEFWVDGTLGAVDTYGAVAEWNSMRLGSLAGATVADVLDIHFDDISIVLGLDETSVQDWNLF